MPPKRKSAAEKALSKRAKVDNDGKVLEVRWEWEGNDKAWLIYNDEQNKAINEAHTTKKTEVTVGGATGVKVMLTKMVQKHKATGWERRVRCACKQPDEKDYKVWEWEEEDGTWRPYSADVSIRLANAKAAGDTTVPARMGRTNCTIDVGLLEQTNNTTKSITKVRSSVSDAKPAPEVKSEPAATKSAATKKSGSKAASTTASSNGVAAKSSAAKSKSSGRDTTTERSVRVTVKKGQALVDPECPKCGTAIVYSEGKDIYDAMLNQTNVQNNNNKFFILQVLQDEGRKSYNVWFRWGRVGYTGQNNLVPCGPDLDQAKKVFCKKFADKTKNDWCDRKKFSKVAGKYDLVDIDYGKDADTKTDVVDGPAVKEEDIPDSKLDRKVQDLVNLICDVKTMTDMVIEMKYDANKNPLGKLTKQQIKAGYSALKTIDTCIRKKDFGSTLTHACNEFYTRIPHDFGFKTPPVIRTKEELKNKMNLLEALEDIEIAMKIINEHVKDENPIDTHYKSLNCGLAPLASADADYKMVCDYLKNTHATTHNQYSMDVIEVFATERSPEKSKFKDVGNRQLLWHGSRLTNWVGILSQGLRIAPPEAPVTGYMFGKGIYFADMCSKSANYCFASRSKNVGLLLLCEVALGTPNELLAASYAADKLPAGKHSVWGKGRVAPDPSKTITTNDGMKVPIGRSKDTGVTNPHGYTLNYNEFIVYDTSQIRIRYLVKVKFNFK